MNLALALSISLAGGLACRCQGTRTLPSSCLVLRLAVLGSRSGLMLAGLDVLVKGGVGGQQALDGLG
jgi:hypothetical protein